MFDANPKAESDLFALYHVDVRDWIANRSDLRLLTGLLERLNFEPRSMYRAEHLGGEEWFGYGFDSARLNDLMDLMYLSVRATAQQKAEYESIAPRPDTNKTKVHTAKRVRDMNWGAALSELPANFQ